MELVILQGIPGSGKSTFAKEFVKGKTDWVIVNRDSIRDMRGDYWIPNQEKWVSKVEEASINSALNYNYNVIIDATNLNPKTLKKWQNIAYSFNAEIKHKIFKIDIEEAIERDKERNRTVGPMVIRTMYNKYKDLYDI